MCRLFGFRSAVLSRAHRSLVAAENALAVQAHAHPDGWGMGWFHGEQAHLLKSEAGAGDDLGFREASERLASHTMVVHVRRATVGEVTPENVHPFRHGRWVFAHNGTLHGWERLGPSLVADTPEDLRRQVAGSTDSEACFHWLLGRMRAAGLDDTGDAPTDVEHLGEVLAAALRELFAWSARLDCPRPVINFLLTDGRVFVANRAGRELHMASQKHLCRDAASCPAEKICLEAERRGDRVNHLLVSSERIGDEDRWEEVPEGVLVTLSADFRLRVREGAGKAASA
jgi:predicted glutamine amidotransferase